MYKVRTEHEVRAMLARLDTLDDEDNLDDVGEAVKETMLWFLGQSSDEDLKSHFEED